MSNPHKVRILQHSPSPTGEGLFTARCVADGCDRTWDPQPLTSLYPSVVDHQLARAHDREIRRRVDWTEPMEDA